MDPFKHRIAVINGGAGGIGMAMARAFVAREAMVVLADLDNEALARSTKELKDAGARVLGVQCDVTKQDSLEKLADATFEHFGAVHILCNNAGVAPFGMMADASHKDWEFAINVNVWGVIHGIRHFVPAFGRSSRASCNKVRAGTSSTPRRWPALSVWSGSASMPPRSLPSSAFRNRSTASSSHKVSASAFCAR
jgi:NAD(P)-dependent dehydrogenase (short-subunit alcohol dehydrogenase family)